jgi:hypothetical protein
MNFRDLYERAKDRLKGCGRVFTLALATLGASNASAAIIGNWNGSLRSWNNGEFSATRALMISRGHTVGPDDSLFNILPTANALIMAEPMVSLTANDSSDILNWVQQGGRLLLFTDSALTSSANRFNQLLGALGSNITFSTNTPTVAPFAPGNFATEGGPFNIVGQTLATTPASSVTGGTTLAGSYLVSQQIGNGFIFAFGDRSDHNFFNPNAGNVNGQLLINIIEGNPNSDPVGPGIPEPSTRAYMLIAAAGGALLYRHRNKNRASLPKVGTAAIASGADRPSAELVH